MPYLKIWIHLVWATKNREPYLTQTIRPKVFNHISEYAKTKGIFLDSINGHIQHVHCLISLQADQNIATVANLLKGESSHWINKEKLTPLKFGWQDEYFAASISHSMVDNVRQYIATQEEHHARRTFDEEYKDFIKKYGFEND
jgi:REP element-mobilizing transposase RayT